MTTLDMRLDEFTLGELETIEDYVGKSFQEILSGGTLSAKAMKAMAYVALRRNDPDATWDDVDKVKVADLNLDGGDDEAPPT